MDKKFFLLVLFSILNFLILVYAQDGEEPVVEPEPPQDPSVSTIVTIVTTPSPSPDPPTPLPTPDPSPIQTPTHSTNPPINPPSNTTPAQIPPDQVGLIENSTVPNDIKTTLSNHNLIVTTNTATTVTQNQKPTQTQSETHKVVKIYPQTSFESYGDNNSDTPLSYLKLLYIMSGIISTLLVIFASYTIYKKGLGDENNNGSTVWENNYEDDGYRNKSTIARGTLTPSIRNTTLGSHPSNPTQNSTNPTNPSNTQNSTNTSNPTNSNYI